MVKQKMIKTTCQECSKSWMEKKTWHGQSEICDECADKRRLRTNCKRHGGRDGDDCYLCQLEGKF